MKLFIERSEKTAYSDPFGRQQFQFPSWMQGLQVPVEVFICDRVVSPTTQQALNVVDASGWAVKVILGNGYLQPIGGTFLLQSGINLTSGTVTNAKRYKIVTFVAGDDFTNIGAASNATGVIFTSTGTTPTTWTHSSILQEITANIAFDAVAATIATALNATQFVTSGGGMTVADIGSGMFEVTWSTAGARSVLTSSGSGLAPLSTITVGTLVAGNSALNEVFYFHLVQSPGASLTLPDASSASTLTATQVHVGDGTHNATWTITVDSRAFAGVFTITHTNASAVVKETTLLGYNISEADMQAALEALSTIGTGNVLVTKTAPFVYTIQFAASLGMVNIGSLAVTNSLIVPLGRSGTLDCRTTALDLILAGASSKPITFEIRVTPSGGVEDYYFQQQQTLAASIA